MTDKHQCPLNCGWIVCLVIAAVIGTICLTGGYLANILYNARYTETTCRFTAYNFVPFKWSNWNCRDCTAYYASITTFTADGRSWATYQATVYPPGNSVERQTRWYQQHWPIGRTVKCYQGPGTAYPPIFQLADTVGTLWSGVAFLALAALILTTMIVSVVVKRKPCCRKGYAVLDDSSVAV